MPATLVPFTEAPRDVNERGRSLYQQYWNSMDCLRTAVKAGAATTEMVSDMFFAADRLTEYWKNRAYRLERSLRGVLATDVLSAEQRDRIVTGLFGASPRDAKTLSKYEGQIVAHYRTMDGAGRQMVRTLFERLTASSRESGGAQ
jgi:hypothetical protein